MNLSASVKSKIDQAYRKFIWSSVNNQRKMSLVSWGRIFCPKCCGGLGFKNMDIMNQALLMKVGWNLVFNPKSLWSQVLLTKYDMNPENLPYELPT